MLIQYYLWRAIFESNNGHLFNITMSQYLSYVGIGLIIEHTTLSQQDLAVGEEVRSGSLAINLLKPFNYGLMVFARHVGDKVGEFVSLIPVILFIILGTGLNQVSPIVLLEFFVSLIFAFVIMFLACYITGLFAFWATNYWGLHFLRKSLTFVFSGHAVAIGLLLEVSRGSIEYIPIPFVSAEFIKSMFGFIGHLAYLLPFQAMYYTPASIYTGMVSGQKDILAHMVLQIIWIVVMLLLAKFVWNKGQKKIAILGG
jgi:ABC-2 type transport system permease protein